MALTLFGMATDFKETQPENASLPIVVTPLGIVIDFKEEHLENA